MTTTKLSGLIRLVKKTCRDVYPCKKYLLGIITAVVFSVLVGTGRGCEYWGESTQVPNCDQLRNLSGDLIYIV